MMTLDQVPTEIEQILNGGMSSNEPLGLHD